MASNPSCKEERAQEPSCGTEPLAGTSLFYKAKRKRTEETGFDREGLVHVRSYVVAWIKLCSYATGAGRQFAASDPLSLFPINSSAHARASKS